MVKHTRGLMAALAAIAASALTFAAPSERALAFVGPAEAGPSVSHARADGGAGFSRPDMAQRVKPVDPFDDLYARGLAKRNAMTSLRANFTETTTSSLLTEPIVAHGTVIAAPPARVRMTYTDPEPKVVTMDGKTLTVVWTSRGEREQIDMRETQKRIDRYFTDASPAQLRSLFDITVQADTAMGRTNRVEMRPKRKQISQGLERLDLWIDPARDLLVRMRMSFPGGDEKTVTLENITPNVPVTDALFQPPR